MEMPTEIYGYILLLSGHIPLLRSISKTIRKSYQKEILKYDLTTPTTKKELYSYLSSNNQSLWLFTQINHHHIEAREFAQVIKNRLFVVTPNSTITYNINNVFEVNRYLIIHDIIIDKYEVNCDICAMYNIIKKRSENCNKYIKSLCVNTINDHCENSGIEFVIIYLYLNLRSFGTLLTLYNNAGFIITAENLLRYDLNYTKNLLKNEVINRIKYLDKHQEKTELIMEMV